MEFRIVDLSPDAKKRRSYSSLLSKFFVALFAGLLITNVAVFSFLIGRNMADQPVNEPPNISMQMGNGYALGTQTNSNDHELADLIRLR
jgi:formate/nitrite transporter FocA (FNT family)